MKRLILLSGLVGALHAADRPNVVVILADDLGSGDVSCYHAQSKIKTPHLDALAGDGVRFTDGHSNSSVCTPTRYGLLTGRYAWRSRLKRGVLNGYSKALIEEGRPTVASLLQQKGYATACIGKWHLGMDFHKEDGKWDYTARIKRSPVSNGFDYFMGISASLDFPPYVLIENDGFAQQPDEKQKAWPGPLDYLRSGDKSKDFKHVDYLPQMARQSVDWMEKQVKAEKPFFLYMPLPSPHKPVLPSVEFKGKSGIGDYGDYVVETDWAVGQVVDFLKKSKQYENTLIIFTSDNASFAIPEKYEVVQTGHKPNMHFRGQKTDIYEGGHRVPYIMKGRKGEAQQSVVSEQTICTTDVMATVCGFLNIEVPLSAGEDSYNFMPVLAGKQTEEKQVRPATVHHSVSGMFSIRKGKWKLVLGKGSGGRTKVPANDPELQLFDMSKDVSETTNLYLKQPKVVNELKALLDTYKESGRSDGR